VTIPGWSDWLPWRYFDGLKEKVRNRSLTARISYPDVQAVRALCRSIRARLKDMLGDEQTQTGSLSWGQQAVQNARRVGGIFLIWPALIVFTGYLVVQLVQGGEWVNANVGQGFGYTQSMLLVLTNYGGKQLLYASVRFEQWPPNLELTVKAVKLFSLRLVSDIMLVSNLYSRYGSKAEWVDEGVVEAVGCVESELGVVLLRLAVTNILVTQVSARRSECDVREGGGSLSIRHRRARRVKRRRTRIVSTGMENARPGWGELRPKSH